MTAVNPQKPTSIGSKLRQLLLQTDAYEYRAWRRGQRRLAKEAGVSEAALSRLLNGKVRHVRFEDVVKITAALERQLGRKLDLREFLGV